MFCSNCGTQIDGKFCPKCGNESTGVGANTKGPKKSKSRSLFLPSVIGGVLLLAMVVGLFLSGSLGGNTTEAVSDSIGVDEDNEPAPSDAKKILANCAKLIGNNNPNEPYLTLIFSPEIQITYANMETTGAFGDEVFAQCLVDGKLVSALELDGLFVEMRTETLTKLVPNYAFCSLEEPLCEDPVSAPYFTAPLRSDYSTELLDFGIRWTSLLNQWTCLASSLGDAKSCAENYPGDEVMVQFELSLAN